MRWYIKPPVRCYQCQRFGHIASVKENKDMEMWRGAWTCGVWRKCSQECCNWDGDHSAVCGEAWEEEGDGSAVGG